MSGTYIPRLVDRILEHDLRLFGAVAISGMKWCGKTTTSKRLARSVISLQDRKQFERYSSIAELDPQIMLKGDKPLLIDEWQNIPEIWDAVRYSIDESGEKGQFILTGSVSKLDQDIAGGRIKHSGIGRIERIRMRTLTLFESGDSNGQVSLGALFDGAAPEAMSDTELEDVARILVRGGWPEAIGVSYSDAHKLVRGFCEMLVTTEMTTVDGRRRDSGKMRAIMRSLSRNIASRASVPTILKDVTGSGGVDMSINTLRDYLRVLDALCITENSPAWRPELRCKTPVRTSDTRYLSDPAIAAYFLGAGPDDLLNDPHMFGLLFENLAVRDLRVYAQCLEGEVFHYRDQDGLEVDAVVHLWDGRWGAVEVKLGNVWADEGAENLLRLRDKMDRRSRPPSFLMVLTATGAAYRRDDGILVVPLTCLRD